MEKKIRTPQQENINYSNKKLFKKLCISNLQNGLVG
jgi:hypothetical protein